MDPIILGSLFGGLTSLFGANKAARAQTKAANQQIAFAREGMNADNARFAPFVEGGGNAFQAFLFENGLADQPENYGGYQTSPMAQYLLRDGRDVIESGAAGRGNMYSGATLAALDRHRTGVVASDRNQYLGNLFNLANMGQSAAGRQSASGLAYGGQIDNALASRGNAQAAGWIGGGNALNDSINNGFGLYGYMKGLG